MEKAPLVDVLFLLAVMVVILGASWFVVEQFLHLVGVH